MTVRALLRHLLYPIDFLCYRIYYSTFGRQLAASNLAEAAAVPRRVLVLSPHQDDETLGCGGYLLSIKEQATVQVAFASDGAGQPDKRTAAEREALTQRRYAEARGACSRLGARDLLFFGFQDGALAGASALSGCIAELVESFAPDLIAAPFVTDAPPDHIAVTRALSQISPALLADRDILLYQVHSQIPARLCNHYFPLSSAVHSAKMDALRCYASQDFGSPLTMRKYLLLSRQIPGALRRLGWRSIERYMAVDAERLCRLFDQVGATGSARSLNYAPLSFITFLRNERSLKRIFR